MIVSYFSVYDKKSRVFSPVFPAPTPGTAERGVANDMKNPDSQLSRWPDDFALYHCFDFDDSSGQVVSTHEPPLLIVEVAALSPA